MNFAALPPEINSIKMYSGPGSGPLLAAAGAWNGLAAELHSAATAYQSVVSRLVNESWVGPSSQAMAAAFTPYVSWLVTTAAQAGETATRAKAAAAAYEAAFAMTVPPSVVAANRAQLLILVATNVLGQNTAAIAVTEAQYAQMWAQDAAAMYSYASSASQVLALSPFTPPPRITNPAGPAQQAAALGQDAGSAAGTAVQQAVSQLSSASATAAPPAAPIPAVPTAATPLPAQGLVPPDLLGLDALAVAGFSASDVGILVSAGAWTSADQTTREILNEQQQLAVVGYDILRAIDVYSPLTPSTPAGYIPSPLLSTSGAMGEAVSVGKLSVPMSWAATAPEIRSLAYTAPTVGAGAASAATAAPAATAGSAGTAFSQMALAGMGGSALAGTVNRGRQEAVEMPASGQQAREPREQGKPPQPAPDEPVTGIAAEIREFGELRDRGLITNEEFNEQKQRLLGQ